jgi:hypothetical protein
MAGTGFHCFANYRALILQTAATILSPWQSAFQCSADCQPPHSGLIRTLWHSALKFGPLTIAIRSTAIFSAVIRLENTTISQYSVMNLSAECSNRVESSPRYFTSRGPLFELSYIFDARLLKCKTDTRRNV